MSQAVSLVSVIIIFRDPGAFLEEAIDSVFAQTHRDWELLLVDDGSTDESTGIARRIAEAHPARVRYLEHAGHENRGMSASRNLGIAEARGDFIAFLDADDVFMPRRLERHLEVLAAAPDVAMVYGPTLYWYGWTGRPEDVARDRIGRLNVRDGTRLEPPELLRRFLRTGGAILPGICSLLARRDVVRQVGGFQESFRGAFEDQVFLSKMALHAPILVVEECLDKYRQHDASYSAQAVSAAHYHPKRANPARRTFLEWLEAHLRDQQVQDPLVWRWLNRELRPYRQPRLHAVLAAPWLVARALKWATRRSVRISRTR